MENRIEECQLDLFADRTSAHGLRANRLRLRFASMAYESVCAVRRLGIAMDIDQPFREEFRLARRRLSAAAA